ncbi:MAG: HlyD family type I secretion periplasmic adaptor subunit [Campylobacterota bacterium]|nr:HlyD family type I secretion periplasmic adaptor subunit [Campylobacterota bacterium]
MDDLKKNEEEKVVTATEEKPEINREKARRERRDKKSEASVDDNNTIDVEAELKKLKRELKREQRATKTAEKLELELKEQRKELDGIINSHMIYVVTNKNLEIKDISQAFIDKFGYSDEYLMNSGYNLIIEHSDVEKFFNGCEYVSSHGTEAWGTDIKMNTIDNDIIDTHTFMYPSFESSVLKGFIFIIDDISTKILLAKFQRKLLASEKVHATALDYVSSTSAAVLDTISYKVSAVVKIVVSFILLFLLYAVSFDIDEISRGGGKFIPTTKVQHLKNFEGGVISAIYVQEGDSIKKGQVLLKLSPITYQTKLDENKIRLSELKAKEARLKAESQGLPMEDIKCDENCDDKLIELEKKYYLTNQRELNKNISKQEEKLKFQESALIDALNKYAVLEENYIMLAEEFEVKKRLEKQKIFTKYELRQLERELNDALSSYRSAKESIVQSRTQIDEIKNTIDETRLTFRNKASSLYNETIGEILRLQETKKSLLDVLERTVVRSPVDGVVKELFVHTIGSSIQPSADILTIVPDNYEMIAEVKMKPEEIAKLHIGQDVKLKVTAFDYSIYGDLEGKITNISPDTITDPDTGDSEYLIYVKTKKNYLNNNEKYKIKVGMMVNADVLVGKKSIMSFLLKPILKTTQKD